jgi:hypothetical protein
MNKIQKQLIEEVSTASKALEVSDEYSKGQKVGYLEAIAILIKERNNPDTQLVEIKKDLQKEIDSLDNKKQLDIVGKMALEKAIEIVKSKE